MAVRTLGWLAALALLAGVVAAFGYAPREAVQGNVQRIMYLHVPAVLTAYLAFGLDFTAMLPALSLVLALGTLGLAAVGTLFGAITAQLRARELLFPVLLLPAVVPILLGSVSATQSVMLGQPLVEAAAWLKLLAAADLVYLVVGVLTFEFVLEG